MYWFKPIIYVEGKEPVVQRKCGYEGYIRVHSEMEDTSWVS